MPFEHWKICEWAVKSIQAYKDIHFSNSIVSSTMFTDVSKEQLVLLLEKKGISSNYNEPMTKEQLKRLSEEQLKKIIENIYITHNLVNIQQVKGEDLKIVDTDKYDYVLTYSFPCQDLSLAGKGKGMSDTSTRSGMLWEVERILSECKELGTMPQVLLMENVPQVHGSDNVKDFNKWQLRLEELGYKNYFQDLIATDYGIPQTRNRCFMVSVLGDYSYTFPQPIPLKLKLKDMLEDNVDEKYYLSDKMLDYCLGVNQKDSNFPRGERFLQSLGQTNEKNIATTITTNAGNRPTDNFIKVKNATKQGYLEATDGDGIDISSRMEYHRGTVQKDKAQTLTTSGGNDVGVVIGTYQYSKSDAFMQGKDRLQLGKETSDTLQTTPKEGVVVNMKTKLCNDLILQGKVKENDVIRHSYTTSRMNGEMKDLKQNNLSPTLDTRCDCLGVVNDLRIRKLTPKECFRLMGVKDEDYEKCAKNQSDSSLYHLAGDSIVVNVLMAIFKELL